MSKDKLVVIGNSVTIRVRPEDGSLTYANIIANKLKLELIHLGEGALLLEEFSTKDLIYPLVSTWTKSHRNTN